MWRPTQIKVPALHDPDLTFVMGHVLMAMAERKLRFMDIETDAGLGADTLRLWFYREAPPSPAYGPSFTAVRNVAAAVGLKLVWEPAPPRVAADDWQEMG